MNLGDVMINIVVILATCFFVDIKWYPQAVGVFMFFILLQANMIVIWLARPLPRFLYAVQTMKQTGPGAQAQEQQ